MYPEPDTRSRAVTGQLEVLGRSQARRVLLLFLRGQVLEAPLRNSSGCVPGVREHATLAEILGVGDAIGPPAKCVALYVHTRVGAQKMLPRLYQDAN